MKFICTLISIATAALVLVSLCASPLSVSAAQGSNANVQALAVVSASAGSAPAACAPDANSLALLVQGANGALWYDHWDGTNGWSPTWTSLGGVLTSSPAATSLGSGLIDVFARGSDGAIWERTTTNGGSSWSAWSGIGGQLASGTGPAVCSQGSRLDVFVQGTNGALWHKSYTGTSWSSWQNLGGKLTSSPAATSLGSGLIDVFARGSDGAIWERTTTNGGSSWSAWSGIGGQLASGTGPAVCSQGSRLDVFVQGTDGALWHKSYTGTSWSSWQSLGGKLTSSPAATSLGSGLIDVFARGSDGAIWERTTTNGGSSWSAWSGIGGQLASGTGPAVCSQGSRLDVFVQGTNGALWHKSYTGTSWSSWQNLGGKLTSSPAATSLGSGLIDVFARGSDGAIWERTTTNGGSSWSAWSGIGGQLASGTGPAVCSQGSRLDVFVQGTDGALYQKTWNGTSWSSWQNLGGSLTSSPAAATALGSSRIDVFVRGTDNGLWQKTYNGGWSLWKSVCGVTETIYYVPQAGSTWVNQGTAGASYNAYVSTPSLFQTQSNGYPYWGTIGKNDFIGIPAGSATNNQNVVSWEIGFHFAGVVPGQRYQKIWDKACGGFMIEIDTALGASHSELTIYRATTGGSGARWYIPTDTVLRAGHNYYVQISWNTSAGPGNEPYPTVWIGEDGNAPVHQTHFDESGNALGGTGSWYNDSVGSANLGNTGSDAPGNASAKTAWLDGGFFVYRQYNSILNFSTGGSWNTDKLRWT